MRSSRSAFSKLDRRALPECVAGVDGLSAAPVAVQNEGSEQAFVTCSFITQARSRSTTPRYGGQHDGTAKTLTCTGVTGFKSGPNQFVTNTIDLPASGVQQAMVWVPAQFAVLSGVFPSSHFTASPARCRREPGSISCSSCSTRTSGSKRSQAKRSGGSLPSARHATASAIARSGLALRPAARCSRRSEQCQVRRHASRAASSS